MDGLALQKQARDDIEDLRAYVASLRNWEEDARRQEEAENNLKNNKHVQKDSPPIRSQQNKKIKPNHKPEKKRIRSFDYSAWEKFDADRICEDMDEEEITLRENKDEDSVEKKEKLLEEAQYEKERGNEFVRKKQWDEAISCYTRAIDLNKYDATFFANRALCHLKKENLHAAETDCTLALELDPKYVKALLRRSTAREGLGSLRRAATDLGLLLEIEPSNISVKRQLDSLIGRMGTKGHKFKSSPATTPTDSPQISFDEEEIITEKKINKTQSNQKEGNTRRELEESQNIKEISNEEKEMFNCSEVIQPIEKPPHLRSKKSLKRIPIQEILQGATDDIPAMKDNELNRLTISHFKSNKEFAPFVKREKLVEKSVIKKVNVEEQIKENPENKIDDDFIKNFEKNFMSSNEDNNNQSNLTKQEQSTVCNSNIEVCHAVEEQFSVPKSSIQFISDWRLLNDKINSKSAYLKAIVPTDLPHIFKNSLESDIFSDILNVLLNGVDFNSVDFTPSMPFLKSLTSVKRFSALAMFLSSTDKSVVLKILERCKIKENCCDEEIKQIQNMYEI